MTRRQFLAASLGWFPFWWRRGTVKLAGIRFRVHRKGHGARRYLLIHGDEATAREVLTAHMKTAPGVAHVVTNKGRYVDFDGGKLDPNRLFTREGAERNLRRMNPAWSDGRIGAALDRLDRERPALLAAVLPPPGGLLVALHNNARGYSVEEEVPISNRTALNDRSNVHEFMLCTSPGDFELLARGPFNVVLQSQPTGEEDGSLSRLAARRGIRYVNIEAGIGKHGRQREMLEFLESSLG